MSYQFTTARLGRCCDRERTPPQRTHNKQGYKHHRKVAAVSQDKTAMYLYSHDQDFAKMLEVSAGSMEGRGPRAPSCVSNTTISTD